MGTSTTNGGTTGNGTPLIPSWLGDSAPAASSGEEQSSTQDKPPIPQPGDSQRYREARSNFSQFVSSGGAARGHLKKAVSSYVSRASGGTRSAAERMGASRPAAGRLLSTLGDMSREGVTSVLQSLNLNYLEGRPLKDILIGLSDYIVPNSGETDAGIARDAYFDMIDELEQNGIVELDDLASDQIEVVLEIYMTRSIEDKLYNEVGTNLISSAPSTDSINNITAQVHDFVEDAVTQAIREEKLDLSSLSTADTQPFINDLYEKAYGMMQSMAEQSEETE